MSISRRQFVGGISLLPLMWNVPEKSRGILPYFPESHVKKLIKPQRLHAGDTVGLVTPSGAIYESEPYQITREALEALGLKVKLSSHLYDRYGHLGGADHHRAQEINEMFQDRDVKAIVCMRGGSGAARIIDQLDYKAIKNNPKIFIGYSDITAFLMAIYEKTGLITFHGPVGISEWNSFSIDGLKAILFDASAPLLSNPGKKEDQIVQVDDRIRTIYPGKARGTLMGGNLSVLTGLVGTPYLPDWKGKILFLEEVGEKIYVIDRMMSQLRLAGILDKLSGFVFGKCTHCEPGKGYGSLTLEEVIDHYIKPLEIPAYSGAMIGHIADKFTVPVGVEAEINADMGTIQLLEPAVE